MRSLVMWAVRAAILTGSIFGTAAIGVAAGFLETDIVANKSPLTDGNNVVHTPVITDPNLVNPWGLGASATSPLWVADNGAGVSTLYNVPKNSVNPLVVSIPAPGDPLGSGGAPTGLVFNIDTNTKDFLISGFAKDGTPAAAPARFLFATEDGTIVGWNPGVNPLGFDPAKAGTYGIIVVDNSNTPIVGNGAVYKGLAIATALGKTLLYVTNFRAGTVEMYDASFHPVTLPGAFTDPKLPRGYAPFNIVTIERQLVVTYAVQDAAKHDDVAGKGHGIVNLFDLRGGALKRFAKGDQLNSPWGVARAPSNFGALADALLIGNFGDGRIGAYDQTGELIDYIRDTHGKILAIDGLWSIRVGSSTPNSNNFGPDRVYFTAGPNGEKDGLFGVLTPH
jgi:uncharacterized protein (TIGR03118 family)